MFRHSHTNNRAYQKCLGRSEEPHSLGGSLLEGTLVEPEMVIVAWRSIREISGASRVGNLPSYDGSASDG